MKKILFILSIIIPSIVNASNYITYPYNSYTGTSLEDISFGFIPTFQSGSTNFTPDNLPQSISKEAEGNDFVYYTVPESIFTNYSIGGTIENNTGNEYIYVSNKTIGFKIYFKNDVNTYVKNPIGEKLVNTDIINIGYSEINDKYLFLVKIKPDVPFTINFNNGTYIYNILISNSGGIVISIPKNDLTNFSIDGIESANLYIPGFSNTDTSYNSYIGLDPIIVSGKKLDINKTKGIISIDGSQINIPDTDIQRKPITIQTIIELPFNDISTSFAKDYIVDLYSKGYVKGYADNKFKPDQGITRAEFLKIVMSAYGKIDSSDLSETGTIDSGMDGFSDTTGWAVGVAKKAKELGYVNGQNGRFRPNDKVSRAEAIKILINVSGLDTSNYENSTILDTGFDDVSEQWMVKFVAKSKDSGIVSGQNGKFRPNDSITRAEASKIIFNSMK